MAKRPQDLDLDIGHFVNSYDSLKEQLDSFSAVLRTPDFLRRWEIPSLTLFCCVFAIIFCIAFPEFLLAFCLSPIPLMLLVTGIKSLGQKNQTELKHIIIIAVETDPEEKLKKKKERSEKATKDLRRFIKIVCEIQHLINEVNKKLEFIQRLFSWEDSQLTLRFMGCVFALMFFLSFIPLYLIMLTGFLIIVFVNEDFMKVLLQYFSGFEVKHSKSETSLHDQKECHYVKWRDGCGATETDNNSSSYEDDSNQSEYESTEETLDKYSSQSPELCPEKRPRSLVSHISEFRKRRQEFNKGNCVACEVAFSSLLTRRRYCRRCGDKFCSKCCRDRVRKAALGATAPGSRDERVLVCNDCYKKLRGTNSNTV